MDIQRTPEQQAMFEERTKDYQEQKKAFLKKKKRDRNRLIFIIADAFFSRLFRRDK